MTDRISEIRARCEAATPGPWKLENAKLSRVVIGGKIDLLNWVGNKPFYSASDFDFIAHAREDVPALLAEVERLQASRDELLKEVVHFAQESVQRDLELAKLEAEAEQLREARRWVPAEEGLPEEGDTFIGWHKDGFAIMTVNMFDEMDDVTHWMPLPAAPEKGAEHERD